MVQDIWEQHAQQWKRIGAPLRPCSEDVERMQHLVGQACAHVVGRPPAALLLGVTEELALMRWPDHTELTAVDKNPAMIASVWPGDRLQRARAIVGDWTAMPLDDSSCDVAVADGSFTILAYPRGYDLLSQQVRRVLRDGGSLFVRVFVRPELPERVDDVFEALFAGRIGNFHMFKWRLAMAVQRDVEQGVRLGDIWDAWHRGVPEPAWLSDRLGWPLDTIGTIDAYRGLGVCYTFPRLDDYRRIWSKYFVEDGCVAPEYECGERFPIVSLRVAGKPEPRS